MAGVACTPASHPPLGNAAQGGGARVYSAVVAD
jgi:hypothetical protein